MDKTDRLSTPYRIAVIRLFNDRGIVPATEGFRCDYLSECKQGAIKHNRNFITGSWVYVGSEYGSADFEGHPTRILFVGIDRGGDEHPDSEEFKDTQSAFRGAAKAPTNPHMGGVSLIMARLTNEPDYSVVSHQFSLTNAVMCVEQTGSKTTERTPAMKRNCSQHLKTVIECLEPQLIITQGVDPAWAIMNEFKSQLIRIQNFGVDKGHSELWATEDFVVLNTPHPARCKGFRWNAKNPALPVYLSNAVKKARGEVAMRFFTS